MENINNSKKTIFAYIFLVILFIVAFLKMYSVTEIAFVIATAADICLAFSKKIPFTLRIVLILFVSVAGAACSIEHLFYCLPVIFLLIATIYLDDSMGKKAPIIFSVMFTHIISEIFLFFFFLMPGYSDLSAGNKAYYIFLTFFSLLELIFIASLFIFIKRCNISECIRQIKKIKAKKSISKNKQNLLSEFSELIMETVLYLCNVCYMINMIIYMIFSTKSPEKYHEYTLSVILWVLYLICFIKKSSLPRLAKAKSKTPTVD